jgi:hypothetical protein
LITCGALLWAIPCTVCKIETCHHGTDVSIKKIYPDFRKPNIPCHFDDKYEIEGRSTVAKKTGALLTCHLGCGNEKFEEKNLTATSSLTGYNCLSSGVGKILNAICSAMCCPINSIFACCNAKDT